MAKKRKVHSLTGRITFPLVHAAWRRVRGNRGAAGIDKVSVKMFEANLDENLQALTRDLKNGSLEPKPLRRRPTLRVGARFRLSEIAWPKK